MSWADIRTEYICGDMSYRALAEQRGVSKSYLMQMAAKEHWKQQRDEYRSTVEIKTKQKAAEKTSDTRAAIADTQERIRLHLWRLTERKLAAMALDNDIDAAELRRMEQVYCDMMTADAAHAATDDTGAAGIIQIPTVDMDAFERMKQQEMERLEGKHG